MKNKNICKFTTPSHSENISVSCFVLETDKNVIETKSTLSKHRIMLVSEGEGKLTSDFETLHFSKGSLLFGFRNEKLSIICSDNFRYMYIDFDGLRAEGLIKRYNINRSNRCFQGFDGLIPLWEESLSRASEHNIDLISESMLIYAFSRLSSDISQRDNILNKILQITEEQFDNFELSIASIADDLGYNPKYLSHLFKERTNKSYSEYLRALRIKHSVSLFDYGIDSVKNAALLSGFSDPLYFSTVFKKVIGVSPKDYIKRINSQDK